MAQTKWRFEKMRSYYFLTMAVLALILSGCPNIPVPGFPNALVVVNQHEYDITHIGVSKIVCGDELPYGINILDENLKPGESFEVPNLSDGEYRINIRFLDFNGDSRPLRELGASYRQLIEGGQEFNLYFKTS